MSESSQKCDTTNVRLEDFISSAKKGEPIRLEIALRKQMIAQNEPPPKPYYLKVAKDMYLLIGDFLFGNKPDITAVSKVYAMGCAEGTETEEQANKDIANERLKMDYQRLKNAGINFTEKYF